ncbi:MAG: hypothetical protein F2840_11540 [Actinobacteria bacterium]|uniref:Unannotated protein n=1 Tax=freshwater metagenome TaxID=449393 RepID=A0A6J7L392_9ZZZZ|nr:hypothetical protein [Actinomycetota bacterium]
MATYECVDEMTIEATPPECFESLMAEVAGHSTWWEPFVVARPRAQSRADDEGAGNYLKAKSEERQETALETELRASAGGTTDRYWSTTRRSIQVTGIETNRRVVMKEVDGDFRGVEEWTFEPMDADRTLVRVHWLTQPHGRMRLKSLLGGVVDDHSLIVREGFRGMERHIWERRRMHRHG